MLVFCDSGQRRIVVPADSGSLLDIDAATALLQFLDGRPSIDYSSVSRTGVSTK